MRINVEAPTVPPISKYKIRLIGSSKLLGKYYITEFDGKANVGPPSRRRSHFRSTLRVERFFSNERQLPPINQAINSPLGTPPLIEHRPCRPLGRRCFSPVPSFVLLRHPRVSAALALHCCSSALDLPQRCSSTSANYRALTRTKLRRDGTGAGMN
jgi:hypothetical protein